MSLVSCKKSVVVNKRFSAYKLFDLKSEILFDRLPTKSSARIKFKTLKPALCELKLWTQTNDIAPTKASPKIIPCLNTSVQTDFVEYISDLKPDILYSVEISVWEPSDTKDMAEKIVLEETPTSIAKEIFWAKINIPLQRAEILKAVNTKIQNMNQIKSYFIPSSGCYDGVFKPKPFVTNISDTGIEELLTKGFFSGVGIFNLEFPQYLRINYANRNDTAQWEWIFSIAKQKNSFISKSGSVFLTLKLESNSKSYSLNSSQLLYPEYPIDIDSNNEIKLAWNYNILSEYSYVLVQVGTYGVNEGFYCIFEPEKSQGSIESRWVKKLSADTKYDLTISLVSTQVKAFPGTQQTAWIITTVDWKTARINKL